MTASIEKQLNESLRDALVAMYLHEVVPADPTLIELQLNHRIETANDLYEYLLLDVLVSQDVPTSPVACAIASLQQYIHGMLMNMEPGYASNSLTPEQLERWREEMYQYPLWAANQQLHYFPSIYLDPTLRQTRTENFKQLENDINLAQIQPDTVQAAVLAYLARFEEIANLKCLNGYIDGQDFANSPYYFVAKSPAENQFYWRSLDMSQRPQKAPALSPDQPAPKYDKPLPAAWSDWNKANVPIGEHAITHSVRPVWFNNRLFIFWADVTFEDPRPAAPNAQVRETTPASPLFRLYGSYKKYDNTWSTPRTYIEEYGTSKDMFDPKLDPHLVEQATDTIAVYDNTTSPETLFLALYYGHHHGNADNGTKDSYTFLRTLRIDKNFTLTPLFPFEGYVNPPPAIQSSIPIQDDEAHVRRVGHLFAHDENGASRFQYWLPHGKQQFGTITLPPVPTTPEALWNYEGLQSKIASLTTNDIRYDPESSTIQVTSRVTDNITSHTTLTITLFDEFRELVKFDLIVASNDNANEWITLLPGSTITALNTDFYNQTPPVLYTFDKLDKPFSQLIVTQNNINSFMIPPINSGQSTALIKTSISRKTLEFILKNPQNTNISKITKLYKNNINEIKISRTTVEITGPLLYSHLILHPLKPSDIPENFNDLRQLARSTISQTIEKNDALSLSFPINRDTLLPEDWPVDWPDGHNSIRLIHGIAVYSAYYLGGPIYLGSAFKIVEMGWSESSETPEQIAPMILHNPSTTLGDAESIDFFGSSIEFSDGSETDYRQPIRMNTTFARSLIQRAEEGMDSLLSWETQHLKEPPIEHLSGDDLMDFAGAYYLYFLELFLYLPWLVAYRLNKEEQFDEALHWLAYLFDPMRQQGESGHPPFWNAVPLVPHLVDTEEDVSHATRAPNDPHQIGLSHPVHLRKALYLQYLDILLSRADSAYRQLTPDALVVAKLGYVQVLDLLGPRPDVQTVDTWAPIKLKALSDATNPELRNFEQRLLMREQYLLENPRPQFGGPHPQVVPQLCLRPWADDPSLPTVDNPYLRLPFNPELVQRWDLAESRLYNLRHNLDMAGNALHLPLFAPPLDPRALLAARAAGLSGAALNQYLNPSIAPTRFNFLYAHCMNAVEVVIQFGATLLSLIERKEQAEYLELQQQQAWNLAKIAVDIQVQAGETDNKNELALKASQNIIQQRVGYYQNLTMFPEEISAGASSLSSRVARITAMTIESGGELLKLLPNIFGVAAGGSRSEAAARAAALLTSSTAMVASDTADTLSYKAQFDRRAQEWQQALDQATLEAAQVQAQLDAFQEQKKATRLQLRMAQTSLEQAKATHDYLLGNKRFGKSQTYDWLNNQFTRLYGQAFNFAQSLCQATEAAWRYEQADYRRPSVFNASAWNASYRGLGAGESLKLGLLELNTRRLLSNERDLEIRKTVSLRQLKDKDSDSTINKPWADILADLLSTGSCEFELTQKMFEADYPGHYLRRIKTISVFLPVLLGPYEDVRATLAQTYSTVQMDAAGTVAKENLRASQQIALSSGIDDSGMFSLNFQDEQYLPFEYTGAVSKWQLTFPGHGGTQKAMLESLTDIIVKFSYTSRRGGQ